MRIVHATVGFVIIAATACPAEAAQALEPWARVGEWQLAPFPPGACFLTRKYASDTYLRLTHVEGGRAQLGVDNWRFNLFVIGSYKMSLIVGGKRRPIGLGRGGTSYNSGLSLSAESGLLQQLRGATALEVDGPDGTLLERLDLGGLAPALGRLPECIAQAALMPPGPTAGPPIARFSPPAPPPPAPPPPPPPPRWGAVQPARPQVPLGQLFSRDDYPAAAARAEEEGIVQYRLDIGRNGRVIACAISVSSGSAALDSTTCRLIAMRARFIPARNAKGKPTEDRLSGRIIWRLPEPEPPPPPSQ